MSSKDIFIYKLFFRNLTDFELESSVLEKKRKKFIRCVNFKVARGLYYLYQPEVVAFFQFSFKNLIFSFLKQPSHPM